MLFAVGFILFFYLDIFISLGFVAIGMMSMAYLITAVALFVSIILIRSNPVIFDPAERRLNRVWIFFLLVFAFIQFISNMRLDLPSIFGLDMKQIEMFQLIDKVTFGLSSILLIFTLMARHKTVFYRWQIFCAFSIFIQALLPVTIWRIMPAVVFAYYGLVQLPMLFGMLMMIDSMLKRRFGFAVEDQP